MNNTTGWHLMYKYKDNPRDEKSHHRMLFLNVEDKDDKRKAARAAARIWPNIKERHPTATDTELVWKEPIELD